MLRLTLRNLVARKVRLLLSAFAIVLGVGFIAGSFVFTDTMASSFDKIAYGTVSDANVRPVQNSSDAMMSGVNLDSRTIDASVVDEINNVDGVKQANGSVQGMGLLVVGKNNRLVNSTGAPTISFNVDDSRNTAGEPFVTWVSGRAPVKTGEVALDERTARSAGYQVGDTVKMATIGDPPIIKAKLTGIGNFTSGGLAGASLVLFDTKTAQDLFLDGANVFNAVAIQGDGSVGQEVLAKRVQTVLPEGLEALSGKKLGDETKSMFDEVLGFLNIFLLVFAGIALVVGSFLIINTFSMLVAQRSSELALLRAIGASKRQVQITVLLEAAVVGIIGSFLGLLFGFALAGLLKAALGYLGIDLSGTGLVFLPRTVFVALFVGLVVTLFAAFVPARRASKVAPVAAMRDDQAMSEGSIHWRMVVGGLLAVLGFTLMGIALWTDVPKPGWWVGGGIISVLLAVIATSVVTSIPVLITLGALFRGVFGFIGRLSEQNARRNPRRTAATAAALTVGLALVTTIAILGASVNGSIDAEVEKRFTADFVVRNPMRMPISSQIAKDIGELPQVEHVATSQIVTFSINGTPMLASATDHDAWAKIFPSAYVAGKSPMAPGTVAVSEDTAELLGVHVGDQVELEFASGPQKATVSGVYADVQTLAQTLIPVSTLDVAGIKRSVTSIAVKKHESAGFETTRRALERVTASNPAVTVMDKASFAEAQRAQVTTLLNLIYALLALAIVIGVLGIVNTLALSVIERTRELGLLRAVGLERGQLRRVIRLESIAIAVLGSVLGIASGLIFGAALQRTFVDDGISVLAIPWVQLIIFLMVAAVVGVLAALFPAHRAAKLNILDAIAVE